MELPFAVEGSPSGMDDIDDGRGGDGPINSSLQQSESSSLVTASSQGSGSFMNSSPLPPNTPQDVVLPTATTQHRYTQQQQQQQPSKNTIPSNNGDPEVDFTYVNVTETDADDDDDDDEVDILLEGVDITTTFLQDEQYHDHQQQQQRGDVLNSPFKWYATM